LPAFVGSAIGPFPGIGRDQSLDFVQIALGLRLTVLNEKVPRAGYSPPRREEVTPTVPLSGAQPAVLLNIREDETHYPVADADLDVIFRPDRDRTLIVGFHTEGAVMIRLGRPVTRVTRAEIRSERAFGVYRAFGGKARLPGSQIL